MTQDLPLTNLNINSKGLHTTMSFAKNLKGHIGDIDKKLNLGKVFCEKAAWQEVNYVFHEFSK